MFSDLNLSGRVTAKKITPPGAPGAEMMTRGMAGEE